MGTKLQLECLMCELRAKRRTTRTAFILARHSSLLQEIRVENDDSTSLHALFAHGKGNAAWQHHLIKGLKTRRFQSQAPL